MPTVRHRTQRRAGIVRATRSSRHSSVEEQTLCKRQVAGSSPCCRLHSPSAVPTASLLRERFLYRVVGRLTTLKTTLQPLAQRLKQASTPRKRGRAWVEIRARWLRAHPLCNHCEQEGKVTAGQELDHVIPLHQGGADDESNYQTLCIKHHKAKTAKEAQGRSFYG